MHKTTRKRKGMPKTLWLPIVTLITVAALAWISPEVPAQDPAPPSEPPAESSPTAEDPPTEETSSGSELETFVPSEKLPADSAISFPVDI